MASHKRPMIGRIGIRLVNQGGVAANPVQAAAERKAVQLHQIDQQGDAHHFALQLFDQFDGGRPVVLLHHPARVEYTAGADESWRAVKQRTFGSNGVTVFQL